MTMTIHFTCSLCEKAVIAPEGTAGRTGRCPSCGAAITIPQHDNPNTEQPADNAAVENESVGTDDTKKTPIDDSFEMLTTQTGYIVNKYIGFNDSEIIIPDKYRGKPIVAIANDLLKLCDHITSIRIEAKLKEIPCNAFYGCGRLSAINLPECLEIIRDGAFSGCGNLRQVTIPKSVRAIGADSFFGSGITDMTIHDGIKSVSPYSFCYCKSLSSVSVSGTVRKIGRSAFARCTALSSVIIGNGVTELADECFCDCTSLRRITIPSTVTSIGENAFAMSEVYQPDRRYNPRTLYKNNNNLTIACYPGSFAQEHFRGQFTCVKAEG